MGATTEHKFVLLTYNVGLFPPNSSLRPNTSYLSILSVEYGLVGLGRVGPTANLVPHTYILPVLPLLLLDTMEDSLK